MKEKMKVMALICLLVIDVLICGMAIAAGPDDQQAMGFGPKFHRGRDGGPDLLAGYVRENLMAQALAEISKQPVATIQKQLEESRLPALLDQYKITPEAFQTAMRPKVTALVNQLVETGYLSKAQASDVLERLDKFAERQTVMKKLIEKGVKDGTITQEQASLLLPGPPR
jgi:polyhydroxyalkanoate synthesis regulator phasin